jgi:uncharacterized membrane protein
MEKGTQDKDGRFLFRPGRKLTAWEKVALVVAAVFLVQYWLAVLGFLRSGNPFGHRNYWSQDVGAFLLAAVCYAGTIAWVVVVWRHWVLHRLARRKSRKR